MLGLSAGRGDFMGLGLVGHALKGLEVELGFVKGLEVVKHASHPHPYKSLRPEEQTKYSHPSPLSSWCLPQLGERGNGVR